MLITCFQFEIKFRTIFLGLSRLTHKTQGIYTQIIFQWQTNFNE